MSDLSSGEGGAREGADFEQLRRLLVEPERQKLRQLQQRLDTPELAARDVSRVLADAVDLSSERDDRLTRSLSPTIERALTASVKRDPMPVVDALFPVIGPAIRRAVAEALRGLMQNLNQLLEHSFSPRMLRWRLQALWTGKPFGEIVLLHTLVYRVEQVLLIHRESSLLLQEVAVDATVVQDGDMVSGMLSAIGDFVRDSFGAADGETLDTFEVGDLTVWVEAGPGAVLAAVIRGHAPSDLRALLKETLEQIHDDRHAALAAFDGDVGPFETTRPLLERCLQSALREAGKKSRRPVLAWLLVGAVIAMLGAWGWSQRRHARRWQAYVERLEREPGIFLTEATRAGRSGVLRGLRDPMAASPGALAESMGLDAGALRLELRPYFDLDPALVLARARSTLAPPAAIDLALEDGVLEISGTAGGDWLDRAGRLGPTVPGVARVDVSGAVASDGDQRTLARAVALLVPPPDVVLHCADGVLSAVGRADPAWIERVRVQVGLIEAVDRFDDSGLQPTDGTVAVLAEARRILDPPSTVRLGFADGVLTLSGTAPQQWIERAATLARAAPAVHAVDADGLVASDGERIALAGAERVLRPPSSVRMQADHEALVLSGNAPQAWIDEARLLARLVPGFRAVRLEGVTVSDAADRVLARARAVLRPPAGVTLAFDAGTLAARGTAPHDWIEEARLMWRVVQGVEAFDDDALVPGDLAAVLLARARVALEPPATVALTMRGDALVAEGSAPRAWIERARRTAPLIEGIAALDAARLDDADAVRVAMLSRRIEGVALHFRRDAATLLAGQDAKIATLVEALAGLFAAGAASERELAVNVIGHADATDRSDPRSGLSRARAEAVVNLLVARGLPHQRLHAVGTGTVYGLNEQATEAERALHRRVSFAVMNEGRL